MTIEIKQLVVRAVVEPRPETGSAAPRPRRAESPAPEAPPAPGPLDREALVAECARQVLRELRKSRER